MTAPLRVGTRASALALWQTEHVRSRLGAAGYATERVEIRTTGDLVQHVPLARIGIRALFTKQIDDAMLEGRIDLAVHSLKDLPTGLPDGIAVVAVGEREDPRDALVGRGPLEWSELPRGAVLATSSLRRRAQLLHLRPDLQVCDIRGNVDTRLAKLDATLEWAGILLATAGLVRLGFARPHRRAAARRRDAAGAGAGRARGHGPRWRRRGGGGRAGGPPSADRARRGRGARLPSGARGRVPGAGGGLRGARPLRERLRLHGRVVSLGGERGGRRAGTIAVAGEDEADALGRALAERLLDEGAASILAEVRAGTAPVVSEP